METTRGALLTIAELTRGIDAIVNPENRTSCVYCRGTGVDEAGIPTRKACHACGVFPSRKLVNLFK